MSDPARKEMVLVDEDEVVLLLEDVRPALDLLHRGIEALEDALQRAYDNKQPGS